MRPRRLGRSFPCRRRARASPSYFQTRRANLDDRVAPTARSRPDRPSPESRQRPPTLSPWRTETRDAARALPSAALPSDATRRGDAPRRVPDDWLPTGRGARPPVRLARAQPQQYVPQVGPRLQPVTLRPRQDREQHRRTRTGRFTSKELPVLPTDGLKPQRICSAAPIEACGPGVDRGAGPTWLGWLRWGRWNSGGASWRTWGSCSPG